MPFGNESVDLLVGRTNLERSEPNAWVLRQQFDGVVHILGFEDEEPAQLLLGLGEGTIRDHHLAVPPPQRLGVADALQRLASRNPMTAFVKHLVKGETLLHHVGLLFRRHGVPNSLVSVSKADESHDFLRFVMTVSPAAAPLLRRTGACEIDMLRQFVFRLPSGRRGPVAARDPCGLSSPALKPN